MKFIIWSPRYTRKHAGIIVLHKLQELLLSKGHEAIIIYDRIPYNCSHEEIAIYPEIITTNLFKAKKVIRYILGNTDKEFPSNDMLIKYDHWCSKTDMPILKINVLDSDFINRNEDRTQDMVWHYKEDSPILDIHKVLPLITKGWPATKEDLINELNKTKLLYTYDYYSLLNEEALKCGCEVIYISYDKSKCQHTVQPFESDYLETIKDADSQLDTILERCKTHWKEPKIAYLCCVLDDPEKVADLFISHKGMNNSKLIIGCSKQHAKKHPILKITHHYIEIPHDLSTVERYNMLYEKVKDCDFTHFGFIGHDCEFSDGYDERIIQAISDMEEIIPDNKYMIYPNDGIHGVNLATHPIFTKEWLDALGYFFPKGYMRHCFVDRYMMKLGLNTKRIGFVDVELIHNNPFKNEEKLDMWQERVYNNEFFEHDKQLFNQCIEDNLAADIKKLSIN